MANNTLFRLCKVIENAKDPYDAGRIKVNINGIDANESTVEDLAWCFPLLPKLLHVRPKPGETVLVIFETIDGEKDNRYYIGPVLSQPYHYQYEHFATTALDALKDARNDLNEPPSNNKDYALTFPQEEDVSLIGRKNAEVRLRENEVRILCGQQETPNNEKLINRMNFNLNPAYIQMKYFEGGIKPKLKSGAMAGNDGSKINSVINIGADGINFTNDKEAFKWFGYDEETGKIDEAIMYDKVKTFIENSHQLTYGDLLIPFLKRFIEKFNTHVHPFPKTPPTLPIIGYEEELNNTLVQYMHLK